MTIMRPFNSWFYSSSLRICSERVFFDACAYCPSKSLFSRDLIISAYLCVSAYSYSTLACSDALYRTSPSRWKLSACCNSATCWRRGSREERTAVSYLKSSPSQSWAWSCCPKMAACWQFSSFDYSWPFVSFSAAFSLRSAFNCYPYSCLARAFTSTTSKSFASSLLRHDFSLPNSFNYNYPFLSSSLRQLFCRVAWCSS